MQYDTRTLSTGMIAAMWFKTIKKGLPLSSPSSSRLALNMGYNKAMRLVLREHIERVKRKAARKAEKESPDAGIPSELDLGSLD